MSKRNETRSKYAIKIHLRVELTEPLPEPTDFGLGDCGSAAGDEKSERLSRETLMFMFVSPRDSRHGVSSGKALS